MQVSIKVNKTTKGGGREGHKQLILPKTTKVGVNLIAVESQLQPKEASHAVRVLYYIVIMTVTKCNLIHDKTERV